MAKISYAGYLGLSPAIWAQFTLEMCVAARNREKITKTPCFGDSWLFKVIEVDITQKLVTGASYDKQHVCAYLQPFSCKTSQYRPNNVFLQGVPIFCSLFCEDPPHPVG